MSGANAIHGVILVGAILVTGQRDRRAGRSTLGPGRGRAGDGQHGRRLRRHRPDARDVQGPQARVEERSSGDAADGDQADLGRPRATWSRPSASSSRSRACRRPKTARSGNLIGACGAALAVVTTLVARAPGPPPADPRRRSSSARSSAVPGRPPGADDADAAAGRAVQRRRRRRGGDRRASLEHVAATPAAGFGRLVGRRCSPCSSARCRSPGRCVTFAQAAGADDHAAGRAARAPGAVRRARWRRSLVLSAVIVRQGGARRRVDGAARCCVVLASLAGRRAVRAAGRRRRRPDRHLAAQRVHRPDRRGVRLRARQRPAARRRHAGRCVAARS